MTHRTKKIPMYFYALMYFSVNPEEELTAEDIKTKFEVYANPHNNVANSLYNVIALGWISKRTTYSRGVRNRVVYYSAGPKLLEQLGINKQLARGSYDTVSK